METDPSDFAQEVENLTLTDSQGKEYVIDMSKATPFNDPNCQHDFQVVGDGEIPNTLDVQCSKCPVGRLVRKS